MRLGDAEALPFPLFCICRSEFNTGFESQMKKSLVCWWPWLGLAEKQQLHFAKNLEVMKFVFILHWNDTTFFFAGGCGRGDNKMCVCKREKETLTAEDPIAHWLGHWCGKPSLSTCSRSGPWTYISYIPLSCPNNQAIRSCGVDLVLSFWFLTETPSPEKPSWWTFIWNQNTSAKMFLAFQWN